jgi:hypothetical protein
MRELFHHAWLLLLEALARRRFESIARELLQRQERVRSMLRWNRGVLSKKRPALGLTTKRLARTGEPI